MSNIAMNSSLKRTLCLAITQRLLETLVRDILIWWQVNTGNGLIVPSYQLFSLLNIFLVIYIVIGYEDYLIP